MCMHKHMQIGTQAWAHTKLHMQTHACAHIDLKFKMSILYKFTTEIKSCYKMFSLV